MRLARAGKQRYRIERWLAQCALYVFLLLTLVAMLLPFVWMLSGLLKGRNEVFLFPPRWVPSPLR